MKPQICIITLCVAELDKSLKFYTEGLGIEGEITRGESHLTISPEEGLPISLFTRGEFENSPVIQATDISPEPASATPPQARKKWTAFWQKQKMRAVH